MGKGFERGALKEACSEVDAEKGVPEPRPRRGGGVVVSVLRDVDGGAL